MNPKLQTPEVDHLFDAVLTLKTREECYKLFSDVCTIKELLAMAQRYEVAMMLTKYELIQGLDDLPSPPAVVMELLGSIDQEDPDLTLLARKVAAGAEKAA